MDLLMVKPAVWRNKRRAETIAQLRSQGARVLEGKTELEVRSELNDYVQNHSDIRVIACGGDGTVHRLLNCVVDLDVSLAVVPLGTGNDFARFLGVKSSKHAMAALALDKRKFLDVGRITLNEGIVRYFAGVASCGFDAQVNERANHLPGPEGTAKYLVSVFGELKDLKSRNLTLTLDEHIQRSDYSLVAVGNTSSYGGGMKICPQARADDGTFNVTIVHKVNRRTLVRVLPRVFNGSHVHHPKVDSQQGRSIRIEGGAFPIYADGERIGIGPASIEVIPGALRVVGTL